jgi:cysteine-rich repeat protein
MQRRPLAIVLLGWSLGAALWAAPARAQLCGPTDDPCIVASSLSVPSGSVFDLGGRDLIIAATRILTVQGAGFLTIMANDITLDDGARIVASGNAGVGGDISLVATGVITLDPSSRVDVTSEAAGSIQLVGASVQMNGQLRATATTRDGEGGFVGITGTTAVHIGGTGIDGSSGNRFGCGGFMEAVSDGSVTVSGPIEFKGGDCDGGDINIDALDDITVDATSAVSTVATYEFGSGGAVSLTAGGDVVFNGTLTQTGAGTLGEGGGDGGDFDIIGNNVTVAGLVTVTGAGPDGSGGFVDFSATGVLAVNAPVVATGAAQGVGGDVLFAADGAIEVNSTVNLTAGFAGGSFDAFTAGTFSMAPAATIDVSGTGSPVGQIGGSFDVLACTVTIPLGADILVTGSGPAPRATARLRASGLMTIGGTINAGALVELYYRSILPVFQPGFAISPAPIVIADGALPCCVSCGGSTTSTSSSTSTTTSSSTSSTVGGGSTTVTVSSTSTSSSTSSTTIPVPCGVPLTGCRVPTQAFKAKLLVRDKVKDSADKIVWKWVRGQATTAADFGLPTVGDDYMLCLWSVAGSPTLIARVDAPAGGTCGTKPCWRTTGRATLKGYKYIDSELTPNGGQKVVLAAGESGKAKAVVKAEGLPLTLPALPLTLPVLVQLQGAGECFETYFTSVGVDRNTIDVFEGRASLPSTTTTTSTSTTSTTSPVAICGNGALELPEQCDDGNLVGGDCCSPTCTATAAGQPCAEDGNVCTSDACNGLGACAHNPGNAGVTCRPSVGQCDATEQCNGIAAACPADVPVPNGTSCDVSACAIGETCTAGVCGGGTPVVCGACEACDPGAGCVPTPAQVCWHSILPEKSKLLIKNQIPDDSDTIVWKWGKGELTSALDFGTPHLDDAYTVCLFDETAPAPVLLAHLTAPPAGVCGGGPCWRPTSTGFKYIDADLTPDGASKVLLKAGASGQSAMKFKAKGVNVPMPALPLSNALRLQLQGNGECWEATFAPGTVSQNAATLFKANSD